MSGLLRDKELNQYRDLVQAPGTFEEGFTWRVFLGTLFVGLIMLPASMYMHLMIGEANLGPAAKFVTIILFLEMAKRARTFVRPAELMILGALVLSIVGGGSAESFFWRQYLVQSDAARSFGLDNAFPDWFVPTDPEVLDQRSFLHPAWFIPLLLAFIGQVVSRADSLILGYGLFRIASDIEKLPFPMAPMSASGILALSDDKVESGNWRWRCFSISSAIGLAFGLIYAAVPTITSTILKEPFQILPIPWLDTTKATQDILPATATGISFDLGHFFQGMAFPFFSVLGSFIGLIVTFIANPILHEYGVLSMWTKGKSSLETLYANNIDFYLSFGIGLSLAVAAIGIYQTLSGLRHLKKTRRADFDQVAGTVAPSVLKAAGRGDIHAWVVIATYFVSSAFYIVLAGFLLDWDFQGSALLWVLLFFAAIYVPFISYVSARLEGLAGKALGIPMIKEAAFILSGYKGLDIWLLPIPMTHNYGQDCVQYRVAELIGCSFRSKWKSAAVSLPIIFLFSVLYGQFIWGLGPIPSGQYPYAQEMWDFNARNQCLMWSSTMEGYSPFMSALHWEYVAVGGVLGVATYMGLAAFGLPILLMYGTVKGLGQTMPQYIVPEMAGALFGRYVMAPRFGRDNWRKYSVVLFAGFSCGVGLMMMFATGIKFLASSVFPLVY